VIGDLAVGQLSSLVHWISLSLSGISGRSCVSTVGPLLFLVVVILGQSAGKSAESPQKSPQNTRKRSTTANTRQWVDVPSQNGFEGISLVAAQRGRYPAYRPTSSANQHLGPCLEYGSSAA
jgi:hypothetical protein